METNQASLASETNSADFMKLAQGENPKMADSTCAEVTWPALYKINAILGSLGSLLDVTGYRCAPYRPYILNVIVRKSNALFYQLHWQISISTRKIATILIKFSAVSLKNWKKKSTLFLKKTSFNVYLEEFFRSIIYSITLKRRGVRVKGAVLSKRRILKNYKSAIIHGSAFLAMGWTWPFSRNLGIKRKVKRLTL